jgi:hypothetical protein
LLGGSEKYFAKVALLGKVINKDSKLIRFSQSTISKVFRDGSLIDDLVTQLINGIKNADTVDPITIFKMADGLFTSFDNRRLYAFIKANKPIAMIERSLDDVLTPELVAQFTVKGKPTPVTYRDAMNLRIGNQNPKATWPVQNPNGSYSLPKVN